MKRLNEDHAALSAASTGIGLCTIVNIDGSFSRRLGAQLAINADGTFAGSLSDGCLENQLASDIKECTVPTVRRYGSGSDRIDFRLPCGGGLDILLDPAPDTACCKEAVDDITNRRPARLSLPQNPFLLERHYIPKLNVRVFGEEPELGVFSRIANACDVACEAIDRSSLSLGQKPDLPPADRWTATLLLFHDHDWEREILKHALAGDSYFIGAQGGENARQERIGWLASEGFGMSQIARVRSPVGATPSSRTPHSLALSIMDEIVSKYEALHPHG